MLHQWTKEVDYLQKACCFALNYFTRCDLMDDKPEYPYSLFEGKPVIRLGVDVLALFRFIVFVFGFVFVVVFVAAIDVICPHVMH
jgi:hypothetical protein